MSSPHFSVAHSVGSFSIKSQGLESKHFLENSYIRSIPHGNGYHRWSFSLGCFFFRWLRSRPLRNMVGSGQRNSLGCPGAGGNKRSEGRRTWCFKDVSVDLMMRCSTTDSCKRGRLFQIIGNFPMSMVQKKISAEVQFGLIHPKGIIFEWSSPNFRQALEEDVHGHSRVSFLLQQTAQQVSSEPIAFFHTIRWKSPFVL